MNLQTENKWSDYFEFGFIAGLGIAAAFAVVMFVAWSIVFVIAGLIGVALS